MKRFLKTICIASIGILLFASCEELTLSETKFECPAGGNTFFFNITTSKSWTAEVSDSSWIKISQEAGNGDAMVTVNLSLNPEIEQERHGSVKIRTSSSLDKFYIVDIIQAGPKTPIFSENDTIDFSSDAQSKVLTVDSDIPARCLDFNEGNYGYGQERGWFGVSSDNGYEFTITVKENVKRDYDNSISSYINPPREGCFKLKIGTSIYKFFVSQNSLQFNESGDLGLSVEWATCNVGANNSSVEGAIFSESEIQNLEKDGWRIPTNKEWEELYHNCKRYKRDREENEVDEFVAKNGNSIKFVEHSYWAQDEPRPEPAKKEEKTVISEPGVVKKLDYSDQYPDMPGKYPNAKYYLMYFSSFEPVFSKNFYNRSFPVRLVRDKK